MGGNCHCAAIAAGIEISVVRLWSKVGRSMQSPGYFGRHSTNLSQTLMVFYGLKHSTDLLLSPQSLLCPGTLASKTI